MPVKIVNFIIDWSGKVLPLPFVLFICDELVTVFCRLAFGYSMRFILPRNNWSMHGKKSSLQDILRAYEKESGDVK